MQLFLALVQVAVAAAVIAPDTIYRSSSASPSTKTTPRVSDPFINYDPSGASYEPTLLGRTVLTSLDWLGNHVPERKNQTFKFPNFYGLQLSLNVSVARPGVPVGAELAAILEHVVDFMAVQNAWKTGNGTMSSIYNFQPYGTFAIEKVDASSNSSHPFPLDPGLDPRPTPKASTIPSTPTQLVHLLVRASACLARALFEEPPIAYMGGVLADDPDTKTRLLTVTPDQLPPQSTLRARDGEVFGVKRGVQAYIWIAEWYLAQPTLRYAQFDCYWQRQREFVVFLMELDENTGSGPKVQSIGKGQSFQTSTS